MSTPLGDAVLASRATRSSGRSGAPGTRLRGRSLTLARVAWVTVVGLIVALFLARLPAYYTTLQTICSGAGCGSTQPTPDSAHALQMLGLSVGTYAALTLALSIAQALLCFTLGAVIFWRRSDDWLALLGALAVVASVTLNPNVYGMDMSSAWGWLAMAMNVIGNGAYLLYLSLSLDGRFVTRWALAVLVYFIEFMRGNQVVIVASTFLISGLFKPLHDRTRALIDRRFYRRKYDAARTLAAFSTTLQQEVDLDRLREALVAVVAETMQPAHVSLWLRPTASDKSSSISK